jgi:hypothetical protein
MADTEYTPSEAELVAALRAACLHDTPDSRKDMRKALIAAAHVRAALPAASLGETGLSYRIACPECGGTGKRAIRLSADQQEQSRGGEQG